MKLHPLSQSEHEKKNKRTFYPPKRSERIAILGWVKRIGVAIATSAALLGPGCSFPGGLIEPSYFYCGEHEVDGYESIRYMGEFDGLLCGDDDSQGELQVEDQATVVFWLTTSSDLEIEADIIDPSRIVQATVLSEGMPVELDLSPGHWSIAVRSPQEVSTDSFQFHLDYAE